jgi:hypothetical protein
MRAVIFRGKRTDKDEWVYGYLDEHYFFGTNRNGDIETAYTQADFSRRLFMPKLQRRIYRRGWAGQLLRVLQPAA